jgi:hypothetical protein
MKPHPLLLTFAAAATLLAALPASAQTAAKNPAKSTPQGAITFYGGYRGGGSFEQIVGSKTSTDNLESSGVAAIAIDWAIDAARNGQVFASGQRTHMQLASGSAYSTVPINIGYLHLGGSNFFEGQAGHGAYVAGGLGATFMAPQQDGFSSEIRPSMSIALGYEYAFTPSLALRGELRGYATLINSSGGFFCSGGCVVSIRGDGMFQGDALLGLSMRF